MRNKKKILGAVLLICIIGILSCNPPWEDHYSNHDSQSDMELWDAIILEPRFSTFVSEMRAYGMDTIFNDGQVYTLFIPSNEAFESITDTSNIMQSILPYHISKNIFINRNVEKVRRLLNISGKYALVEFNGSNYTYDGIPMEDGSPLFLNGKYYEITEVALPRPNLYEFAAQKSPTLKNYIDSKDSIYLDRSLSTPIGFNEAGNTVYDSVFGSLNTFELEYFPVRQEFRDKNATLIIFSQEQYIAALNNMAERLGGAMTDYTDIPKVWQNDVLLPYVTSKALFGGILSYSDLHGKLQSVTGDTVEIIAADIDPDSRSICSNGVAYLYNNFVIPDELFRGTSIQEGELLIDSVGAGKFAWKAGVNISGAIIAPIKSYSLGATEGSFVSVLFNRNYAGEYTMEFTFKNVFPMRYRLEWHANYRPSGLYEVYVNDQLLGYTNKFGSVVTSFDNYELRNTVVSVTGERISPVLDFNSRDYWVDHLTEYGDVRVKFKYIGAGASNTNGFNIDYVKLIPAL